MRTGYTTIPGYALLTRSRVRWVERFGDSASVGDELVLSEGAGEHGSPHGGADLMQVVFSPVVSGVTRDTGSLERPASRSAMGAPSAS